MPINISRNVIPWSWLQTTKGVFKFRSSARKRLLEHRANLLNGGRFYLRKKNYTEAFRFLDLYLSSAEYPALKSDFLNQTDTMYSRVAYWIIATGYHIGATRA